MITKWKLFNFKAVQKETEIDCAPLTIFAGANSSGKSTVLQSMLLIAQTVENRVSSRSVVLNGTLTRLGQFDDIRSAIGGADQIVIGFECRPQGETEAPDDPDIARGSSELALWSYYYDTELNWVRCELSFDANPSSANREVYQLQPRLFGCAVTAHVEEEASEELLESSISVTHVAVSGGTSVTKMRSLKLPEPRAEEARMSLDWDVTLDETSLVDIREQLETAEPVGSVLRHFLPISLSLRVDRTVEDSSTFLSILHGERTSARTRRLSRSDRSEVPVSVSQVLKDTVADVLREEGRNYPQLDNLLVDAVKQPLPLSVWIERLRGLPSSERNEMRRIVVGDSELRERLFRAYRHEKDPSFDVVPFPLPQSLRAGVAYIERFFANSVKYLGPLRDEPKAMYPLAGSHDPLDIGLRGEHTAAVLDSHKNRQIRYVPSACFRNPEVVPEPLSRSLEIAVVDWLQYLGVASSVTTRDRGKFGHELKVSVQENAKVHDLTHVGVGVSQVLPILVMSLLAERDTSLIFEQPELHLHPKVQTRLGDFFLSMTQLGKQCIVETHSEYLINRLRFRTAAATNDNPWLSATKVYFVKLSEEGSSFRDVEINEYGAVVDWPEGFFDQSQEEAEAILQAAAIKRKIKRRK